MINHVSCLQKRKWTVKYESKIISFVPFGVSQPICVKKDRFLSASKLMEFGADLEMLYVSIGI